MAMFGVNIEIGQMKRNSSFIDEEINSALKRDEERKLFRKFLNSEDSQGNKIIDELMKLSQNEAEEQIKSGEKVERSVLLEFAVSNLKEATNNHLSLYDSLVRKIVEEQNPEFKVLHDLLDKGKFDGRLPFGYPDVSKKATGILTAKIKDSLGDMEPVYLKRKFFGAKVRSLVKEMFHTINKLGLKGDQIIRYLKVVFELSGLQEAEPVKPADFRKIIGQAISDNQPIDLVHIKCLRFVYPKEGGVDILTDTSDAVVDGVLGRYSPKSERNLFPRLLRIKEIFHRNGIPVNFHILIADDDLDLLFPSGNKYVDRDNLADAKRKTKKYLSFLQKEHGGNFSFVRLRSLAFQTKDTYESFRATILRDIRSHGGKFVDPNFFEKDRVDHQFSYYRQLFGSGYSREEARRSIAEQTASTIALKEILKTFGEAVVLVEENRGGENKLIANGNVPIIFTKLRDEAKFDVK